MQAQAVSQEIISTVQTAISTSFVGGLAANENHRSFAETVRDKIRRDKIASEVSPDTSGGCVTSDSGTTCNFPVSYTGSCPQGGAINVSGDFSFTLSGSGSGSDSTTLTVTPVSCEVQNMTINGDPNVAFATQVNFQNDALVYPITSTESGAISFGPNPSGTCSINATLTITSAQTCTVSGTVCGQTLSGNCLPPTD
jgi:hypothetical protein